MGIFWVAIILGGNYPVGIIRVAIFLVPIFLANFGENTYSNAFREVAILIKISVFESF